MRIRTVHHAARGIGGYDVTSFGSEPLSALNPEPAAAPRHGL